MTRTEIAEAIEETENDRGLVARTWTGGGHVRVYVIEVMSRGRKRERGYIDVREDGVLGDCGVGSGRMEALGCVYERGEWRLAAE